MKQSLEKLQNQIAEVVTFSGEVPLGDQEAYADAMRKQGVSEETIQALVAEINSRQQKRASQMDVSPAANCRQRTDGAEARNGFGQVIYRYASTIEWCYNGTIITSLDTWQYGNGSSWGQANP